MNPVVLHVVRPYSSEEEFLEAEAWTIEARAMLLLDQRELEPETPVVFDVGLANGAKIMRAEARVAGFVRASDGEPSGLRVRFRRYGSQTKSFIERALVAREEQLARAASSPSSPPPDGEEEPTQPSAPPPPRVSTATLKAAITPGGEPAAAAPEVSSAPRTPQEPSGVHRRPLSRVPAPPNREELLERLRERARCLETANVSSKSGTE